MTSDYIIQQAAELVAAIKRNRDENKLLHFGYDDGDIKPYPYQLRFFSAKGRKSDLIASIRALMAANQTGKTYAGSMETSMHLTGLYPDWWRGYRFDKPINAICGTNTNEAARDILQKELLGEPGRRDKQGTGAIPKSRIISVTSKPGVPNAVDSVHVQSEFDGVSKISIRAYEQGWMKFQGLRIDWGWMDEEPKQEVYSQFLRGTISTNGMLILTFTPEQGITDVVYRFLHELSHNMALVRATWDDALHLTYDRKKDLLRQFPAHEREMRSKGVPVFGSGLIFPIPMESIVVDPINIPSHWPRIVGFDFGIDHPAAMVWFAFDLEENIAYAYREWREKGQNIATQADALKKGGEWIPVAWPHDVASRDKTSGRPYAAIFRDDYGVYMLQEPFSNPPPPGMREGTGGRGIEAGLGAMLAAMQAGSYKITKNCVRLQEEMIIYHRKISGTDGKSHPVALNEDLISASRYGFQMRRFATTEVVTQVHRASARAGLTNW